MTKEDLPEEENEISALALGYIWSSRIISLSIEMGLITLGFFWVDKKLGTAPIFLIVGAALAIAVFFYRVIAMVPSSSPKENGPDGPSNGNDSK